jgi:hypothetical protein
MKSLDVDACRPLENSEDVSELHRHFALKDC